MKLGGQSEIQNVLVESSGSKQTSVAEGVLDLRRFRHDWSRDLPFAAFFPGFLQVRMCL